MTGAQLLSLFRDEMDDLEVPYLWSDTRVYSYIDDAQRTFCRWTNGLAESDDPGITELDLAAEDDGYVCLSPLILHIRSATKADTGAPVEVLNYEDLATRGWRYDGARGPLRALVIGESEHKARPYPVLSTAATVKLMVYRLPKTTVSAATSARQLEIDSQHHEHLLLWAKARAYGKQDAETFDKTKKRDFELEFRAYCKKAKDEQDRAKHKHRAVAYGGIDMTPTSTAGAYAYGRGRW